MISPIDDDHTWAASEELKGGQLSHWLGAVDDDAYENRSQEQCDGRKESSDLSSDGHSPLGQPFFPK
jgi:hypothetical protein